MNLWFEKLTEFDLAGAWERVKSVKYSRGPSLRLRLRSSLPDTSTLTSMSIFTRTLPSTLRRSTLRQAPRSYSTAGASSSENEFVREREAIKHHAAKSGELWRKIT